MDEAYEKDIARLEKDIDEKTDEIERLKKELDASEQKNETYYNTLSQIFTLARDEM